MFLGSQEKQKRKNTQHAGERKGQTKDKGRNEVNSSMRRKAWIGSGKERVSAREAVRRREDQQEK